MLSPSAYNAWKAAGCEISKDFGARVMAIKLLLKDESNKDIRVYLVSAYAPVGNAKQHLWDNFFQRLELCINRKRKNDVLVLGCDTNSSMGTIANNRDLDKSSIGKFGLSHRNHAGIRFHSFLEINGLIVLTTYFRKKKYATWSHPRSKLPHQIDHIVCQKSDFMRFTDACSTKPLIDSDHCAIKCKIRFFSPQKKKVCSPRSQMLRLNIDALNNPATRNNFCNDTSDLFYRDPANSSYDRLEHAMSKAATQNLPKSSRNRVGSNKTKRN